MEAVVFFIIGLAVGFVTTWVGFKLKFEKTTSRKQQTLLENYVSKELFQSTKDTLKDREESNLRLTEQLAISNERNNSLIDKLNNQEKEINKIQETFKAEFKNLSNDILDEKSKKFIQLNEDRIGQLLNPLRDKISDFERKVEETHKQDIEGRSSLREKLDQIVKLNQQVSEDANRLTKALKGDSKVQGNWGEIQLEMILEKVGLQKDVHFKKQTTLQSDEGKSLRPDYIIMLPENKNLILDSKVSLTNYELYYNTEDENEKTRHLKGHISSLYKHISELGEKSYQAIYDIHPPDYVLMFVPIEPALTIALREDLKLYEKALERNVVMVSISTLLATLRTISYIWKQENQKKYVNEIARESGKLYDKFVGFVEDLNAIGKKIEETKGSYDNAMNKLVESSKKGDTIVGRIERIKSLGANSTKSLPTNLLDKLDSSEDV